MYLHRYPTNLVIVQFIRSIHSTLCRMQRTNYNSGFKITCNCSRCKSWRRQYLYVFCRICPKTLNLHWFLWNWFTVFTQEQLDQLSDAWADMANSDTVAIQGIVDRINGLETMLYDPGFKFDTKYIGNFYLFVYLKRKRKKKRFLNKSFCCF